MIFNSTFREFSFILFYPVIFYLIIHLLQIPVPSCLLLKHFKYIYPQLSAPILLRFSSLDLWSSSTIETLDSHSITGLTGSTTMRSAHSVGLFTSSPSLWLTDCLCGFLSSVSAELWCSNSGICLQICSKLFWSFSLPGCVCVFVWWWWGKGGTIPMSYSWTAPAIIWLLNILNMVMSATSSFF